MLIGKNTYDRNIFRSYGFLYRQLAYLTQRSNAVWRACRGSIAILCCLLPALSIGQSVNVSEDFNHNSQATSEANCWEFDDVSISSANSINTGAGAPQADADIYTVLGADAELRSPFIKFNGSGNITFKHKMSDDEWYYGYSNLSVYLRDPFGNTFGPAILDHTYRFFPTAPNGTPTNPMTETISINWTGYYQVVWRWTAISSYADGLVDDIVIPNDTTSYIEYDTVCTGDKNVLYQPSTANSLSNFSYTWNFVGPAGGSLTTSSSNNRKASVDWTNGAGDYQLKAIETYNGGCAGRKTIFKVHVVDPSTVSAHIDTTCAGENPEVLLTFTGSPPWELKYKVDGGSAQTFTTSSTNVSLPLPGLISSFNIINLKDNGPCNGTVTGFSTLAIYYFPAPIAGPLYHY